MKINILYNIRYGDTMKKFLIVGDMNSIHNFNYVKNVLLQHHDFKISAFNTSTPSDSKQKYYNFYVDNGIRIYGNIGIEQGLFYYIIHSISELIKMDSYDICHVMYINHYICPLLALFSFKFRRIVFSYWGSDLLRSNKLKRILCWPLLIKCDRLSFITKDMQKAFASIGTWYLKKSKDAYILDFGNMFFETIDLYKNNISDDDYKDLQLLKGKITVGIGYCYRTEMRQYETCKLILESNLIDKNFIQIAIPAYGMPANVKDKFIKMFELYDVNYVIYDYFMEPNEVSKYRVLCDIFIHSQTTDALSSAMLEHLYAGTIVLNGEWLRYDVLDKENVYYRKFGALKDVIPNLLDVLNNIDIEKLKSSRNREKISSFCSWTYWKEKWDNLYE